MSSETASYPRKLESSEGKLGETPNSSCPRIHWNKSDVVVLPTRQVGGQNSHYLKRFVTSLLNKFNSEFVLFIYCICAHNNSLYFQKQLTGVMFYDLPVHCKFSPDPCERTVQGVGLFASQFPRLRFRIPLRAWMFVCCVCSVLCVWSAAFRASASN